ncbi:MFS transporter [Promicromonospora sukumoe]|uniref:Putative MFS family arabinose efflux permease n=1 Tax=Promicromonospora sukumoe TaxID=88382 RepID=A0A7W3PD68_9MICO|nr:MFS transporter [Promicromonospora sukumoe]MBA8807194.1 putative MFS family arabinose efflux permease [Promicromonospora sukumoe]
MTTSVPPAPMPAAPAAGRRPGMSRGATFLFALAGGAAVGNLYWSQPILDTIATGFGTTASAAGLLVTVTQIGYAVGVFFLVPLGDVVDRKVMIPLLMLLAAVMLGLSALAPSLPVLLVTLALVGVSTVSGQLLAPLAGDLATDEQRGRVLGTVVSGVLLGILVARAVSGVVTDLVGWRALYAIVAAVMLVLAVTVHRFLPRLEPRARVGYGSLLASVPRTYVTSAAVRWLGLMGAAVMATFTLYWTGLTLLLSAEPFGFSTTRIGLLGLVGILGALAAQQVGRLHDRGLGVPAIGVGLVLAMASFVVAGVAPGSIVAVVVSVALYSVGVQAVQMLLQARVLAVDPSARSRLNTVFVVGNFVGGTVGSALAGLLWGAGGWPVIMTAAGLLLLPALLIWAVQRRRAFAA